jgi:hypothetical protein
VPQSQTLRIGIAGLGVGIEDLGILLAMPNVNANHPSCVHLETLGGTQSAFSGRTRSANLALLRDHLGQVLENASLT